MTREEFLEEADQLASSAFDVFGKHSKTEKAFLAAYAVAEKESREFDEYEAEENAIGTLATKKHA